MKYEFRKMKDEFAAISKVARRRNGFGAGLRIEPISALLIAAMLFPMVGTASERVAAAVKLQQQVVDQADAVTLDEGVVVYVPDSPKTPLRVGNGTAGGIKLPSSDGVVLRVATVTTSPDADWTGWSARGTASVDTNGVLSLASKSWVDSPVLKNGVNSYDFSDVYHNGGNSWSITVYTGSFEQVTLPYFGTDARLRLSVDGFVGDPGGGLIDLVTITNTVSIEGFEDPTRLNPSDYVPNNQIVSEPTGPKYAARLDTVTKYHDQALAYTVTKISEANADASKVVRGSLVWFGNRWHFETDETTNSATTTLGWGGFGMLELSLGIAAHEVDIAMSFATNIVESVTNLTMTALTLSVSTNGVTAQPMIEYCSDLNQMEWRPVTVTAEDWPTPDAGRYAVTIDPPDGDAVYFRCLSATSKTITSAVDVYDFGEGVQRFHGSSGGTNRTAITYLNWDTGQWITEITDD